MFTTFGATHTANPVRVNASAIARIGAHNGASQITVGTKDGIDHIITPDMLSRYSPVLGDYVVIQEDGYVYVNPKAVFERKYSPLDPE